MILPNNNSMRNFPKNNHVLHYAITPYCTFTQRMRSRTKQDPIPCTFLHVRRGKNVLRFIDIKYGDEKSEDPFSKKSYNTEWHLQKYRGRLIQRTKARTQFLFRTTKCNRKKSVYGLRLIHTIRHGPSRSGNGTYRHRPT